MFTSGAGILDQPFLNLVNWETGKGFSQGGDMKTDKKNIHSASLLSFSDQRCNRALYQKSGILEKGQ